jgi:hypothetical protein
MVDDEEIQNENVVLAAIEETGVAEQSEEEQYFSCEDEIPKSPPKRRRAR